MDCHVAGQMVYARTSKLSCNITLKISDRIKIKLEDPKSSNGNIYKSTDYKTVKSIKIGFDKSILSCLS